MMMVAAFAADNDDNKMKQIGSIQIDLFVTPTGGS